jgi:hypothetical protein
MDMSNYLWDAMEAGKPNLALHYKNWTHNLGRAFCPYLSGVSRCQITDFAKPYIEKHVRNHNGLGLVACIDKGVPFMAPVFWHSIPSLHRALQSLSVCSRTEWDSQFWKMHNGDSESYY